MAAVTLACGSGVVGAEQVGQILFTVAEVVGVRTQCALDSRAIHTGPVGVDFALDGQVNACDGLACTCVQRGFGGEKQQGCLGGHGVDPCQALKVVEAGSRPAMHWPRPVASARVLKALVGSGPPERFCT